MKGAHADVMDLHVCEFVGEMCFVTKRLEVLEEEAVVCSL